MDPITEMDKCTAETLEDIQATLRGVSVGIVLTPLSISGRCATCQCAHGETLPLVFLRLPEHEIDVNE